jgi:hypothetical protein
VGEKTLEAHGWEIGNDYCIGGSRVIGQVLDNNSGYDFTTSLHAAADKSNSESAARSSSRTGDS